MFSLYVGKKLKRSIKRTFVTDNSLDDEESTTQQQEKPLKSGDNIEIIYKNESKKCLFYGVSKAGALLLNIDGVKTCC